MRKLILVVALWLTACLPTVTQPVVSTPTLASPPSLAPQPTPTSAKVDLTPYRTAMRAKFAGDVDQFTTATRYQIDLTLAPDLASYSARQTVHYTNNETEPLSAIYFRLFPNTSSYGGKLTLSEFKLNGQSITPITELSNSALRIPIDPPLPIGASVDFEMAYQTKVPTSSVTSGYNQFGLFSGVLALPNFYPQIPAYDSEGWNVEVAPGMGDAVFSDSALYQVNILAPKNQLVVTSGTCESQAAPNDQQSLRCISGPMRDFMIASSADFQVATETVDDVQINSYFLKKDAAAGRTGLQVTTEAFKSYSKRIGPYPFNQLDLVETPTTAGGIEYPGLIVVAQSLYEEDHAFQEGATAHEAAHQWWYSLVGNDQVDDPWLDEAFTQFTTGLYYLDRYGQDGLSGYVDQSLMGRYRRVKGTEDDKRSDLPVAGYSGLQYGAIVYGKAALFFNGVYEKIGDDKFNQFMQTYFNAHRYGIAYEDDLLKAIETQLDAKTVDELMKEWITSP
ncbi:MAG: M1 family metallopeptidase [Anaerolineae bacterium]